MAATPATNGLAIEVPLRNAVAAGLVFQSDWIPVPGANRSTQVPKSENVDRVSAVSVAATVIAGVTSAGTVPHASALAFPAAMTYVVPAVIEFRMPVSSAGEPAPGGPPRLMFTTVGVLPICTCCATQFTPASTVEYEPFPLQSSTRTETSDTFLATP